MRTLATVAAVLLVGTIPESRGASPPRAPQELPAMLEAARTLLRDLVAIDTSAPNGSTTPAAERAAAHLRAAGLPAADVQVIGASDRHRNLVARLRGKGKGRPVLFLAHLDVVPAARTDWTVDPFALTEQDGYYYGRGTSDDKQFCAIWTAVFARLAREGFVPDRDAIMRTTCVATQLEAGHAPNALPQRARANVNCRMVPGDTVEAVRDALIAAIGNPELHVTVATGDVKPAPPVQLDAALLALIERAAGAVWPGVPVMPVMETGGTDGVFFRERGRLVYGLNHFENPNDSRAHGRDERIGVKQFDEAVRFGYELARRVGRVESP